jgi:phosphoenolpyruvate carboxykinase (ATP)
MAYFFTGISRSKPMTLDLSAYGISVANVVRNPSPPRLYEDAIRNDKAVVTSTGAVATNSGEKTGRSPKDKRVVDNPDSTNDIWWGDINMKLDDESFLINRQRALDYLNTRDMLYVIDGFAGWDPKYQIKVRIICARAYHALFMHNMLIRPTAEELQDFGDPDYVVFNAGQFPADATTGTLTSPTSVNLNFERSQFVILGTQYAGEMKKGVFTIMNYLMPKRDVLSMHCSANEGTDGDVSLFFGLSGTGKTTLSTEAHRQLIGDDEHCWSDDGIFNIEGGCYAKAIDLSAESEPEIYNAIRYGTVLENTVQDELTREVDYSNSSLTENTRASYPIEYIPNAKIPCVGGHPKNVILLTCDAFGVLPPVSRLTPEQAMYHFISGYTAKVAGTEVGVTDPIPNFSACFGAAFLVWHPTKYAQMLAAKMEQHGTKAWLLNTGWSGGPYGVGKRLSIKHTRAIVDAIHSGELAGCTTVEDPLFGLHIPTQCANVPNEVLIAKNTWDDKAGYAKTAKKLAGLFRDNFAQYGGDASDEIRKAGPKDPAQVADV